MRAARSSSRDRARDGARRRRPSSRGSARRRTPRPAAGASRRAPGGACRAPAAACRRWRRPRRRCPASTSSNTSVGTCPTSLVTTWIASAMRDSSPPDATARAGRRLLRMARDAELDLLQPVARAVGQRHERDLEPAAGHRELLHRRRDAVRELVRGEPALLRQLLAERAVFALRPARRRAQRFRIGGRRQRGEARLGFRRAAPAARRAARDACARRRGSPRAAPRRAASSRDRGRAAGGSRAARAPPRRAGCAAGSSSATISASAGSCAAPSRAAAARVARAAR